MFEYIFFLYFSTIYFIEKEKGTKIHKILAGEPLLAEYSEEDNLKLINNRKIIEDNLNLKAKVKLKPMQLGDVKKTYADITKAKNVLNWKPEINFKEEYTPPLKFKLFFRLNSLSNSSNDSEPSKLLFKATIFLPD